MWDDLGPRLGEIRIRGQILDMGSCQVDLVSGIGDIKISTLQQHKLDAEA